MKRAILTLLVPLPLILMGLTAVFFLEFQKHRVSVAALGGPSLTVWEFAQKRYAKSQHKRAVQSVRASVDVRKTLPQTNEGWTQERYSAEHGVQITGADYKPSALVKDTEKSIQDTFLSVKKYQPDAATASYIKGDDIVSLHIELSPERFDGDPSLEAKLAKNIRQTVGAINASKDRSPVFTVVDGVEYVQLPQISVHLISQEERPVAYRRFEAMFDGRVSVFVFTNASDTAVRDVLRGIDYAKLREYVALTEIEPPQLAATPADTAVDGNLETAKRRPESADDGNGFLQKMRDWVNSDSSSDTEAPSFVMSCSVGTGGAKRCVQKK